LRCFFCRFLKTMRGDILEKVVDEQVKNRPKSVQRSRNRFNEIDSTCPVRSIPLPGLETERWEQRKNDKIVRKLYADYLNRTNVDKNQKDQK